jgi:hypothetical protein
MMFSPSTEPVFIHIKPLGIVCIIWCQYQFIQTNGVFITFGANRCHYFSFETTFFVINAHDFYDVSKPFGRERKGNSVCQTINSSSANIWKFYES